MKGRTSPNKGKHHTKKTKKKISRGILKIKEKLWNWKGGITKLGVAIYNSMEYREWRKKVFSRDCYTCKCGKFGGKLEAHHIVSFHKIFKEFLQEYNQFSPIEDKETLLRLAIKYEPFWEVSNGITLCKECHKLTKGYLQKQGGV